MRALATLVALSTTACGSGLWLITPRPDITHYEVTRIAQVEVSSTPPGAMIYVDGAEAGLAPRRVPVAYKEIRQQRRQSILPAIIGTVIDVAAGAALTLAALDSNDEELAIPIAAGTIGIAVLDLWLITGRSIVNEGVDVQPFPVEIGVRAPGFADAARRVRVPDFTKLEFRLEPGAPIGAPPSSPPAASPAPTAPPAPTP